MSQRTTSALVTGAGSPTGIGCAIARALGRQGCRVIIASTTARIQERAQELREAGIEATGLVADLTDAHAAESLVDAAGSDAYDAQLRASHAEGIGRVGEDVGTPVVAFGDTAFFGPVVTPAPKGEAAGRLWDGCVLVASTPGFFELKRTRTQGPVFD